MKMILLKLLKCQGGWMAAIPAAMSMVSSIMNMVGSRKKNSGAKQSGIEKDYVKYNNALREKMWAERGGLMEPMQQAGVQGGMLNAISDAFNPNPTTTELQGVTGQARQQMNAARNMGVRGGQLRSQMLDIQQGAARNRLALMENARQAAAQRGFQTLLPTLPSQSSDIARQQLTSANLADSVRMDMARAGIGAQQSKESGQAAGGGIMGGLFGSGGSGGLMGMLGGLFGGGSSTNGGVGAGYNPTAGL